MSRRAKPFRARWSKHGSAQIIATAAQVATEGNRTLLLLQAWEALDLVKSGERSDKAVERLGNAVDYALILAEGVGQNAAAIEQIRRGQDCVMELIAGRTTDCAEIGRALEILDMLFAHCSPMQIGKARQEWRRRVDNGLVLEVAAT